LSVLLQEKSLDLSSAIANAKTVIEIFKELRQNVDEPFHNIYLAASALANAMFSMELEKPRITTRQRGRANPETDTVEDYYRVTIFIPCLDGLIQNLTDRLVSSEDFVPAFQLLLPRFTSMSKASELESLLVYFDDEDVESPSLASLTAEYELWSKMAPTLNSNDVLEVLANCDGTYFRNIRFLLTVPPYR